MSAIGIFPGKPGASEMYLLTDAASWDKDGIVRAIGSKVVVLRGCVGAMSVRGAALVGHLIGDYLSERPVSFDVLVGGALGPMLEECQVALERRYPAGPIPGRPWKGLNDLAIAGWSESRRRLEAYYYFADANAAERGERMKRLESSAIASPPPSPDYCAAVGWFPRGDFVPERDAVHMIEGQRRSPWEPGDGDGAAGHLCVGGFAELTTITREGVRKRVVRRWPEDRVGYPIVPEVLAPAGLSRQQRRALEREQRRAAAA